MNNNKASFHKGQTFIPHWKQETGGLALSMTSEVHEHDPCPNFPDWLFAGDVVAEIASLAHRRETPGNDRDSQPEEEDASPLETEGQSGFEWTPTIVSREMIASTEGTDVARHLEWVAWEHGITAAKRQAFVADGASSIWAIHKRYFSQMTAIIDLMHALSYAYRAAAVLDEELFRYTVPCADDGPRAGLQTGPRRGRRF